ncbi:hypothetical protein ACIBW9_10445 [Streptomyces sp. NPDC049541]|uniref:hypothetical protein n=1 Tax=Streptomyces sp. NPDC049541 TaxID=3365594 RepID=UPI00379396C6
MKAEAVDLLLGRARQVDAQHRELHRRPASDESLRKELRIGTEFGWKLGQVYGGLFREVGQFLLFCRPVVDGRACGVSVTAFEAWSRTDGVLAVVRVDLAEVQQRRSPQSLERGVSGVEPSSPQGCYQPRSGTH